MSLAKPLSALRQDLRELLIEDLPTALRALDELLPDGSEKKAPVTALRAAFNQLNRERGLGVIDHAAYALRLAQLSANFLSLLDTLTEADFEPPAAAVRSGPPEPKRGSVLYKIPRQMPLRKASLCTVRVAVDEEAIFDDLVMDDGVRVRKRVEVSDMMTAELLDIEGNVFQVAAFNDLRQRVRDTGYTQWLFRVTPLVEGEHQLMVKVSLMEFDPNTREYVPRNVSILETVTIVTEAPAPSDSDDTPMRSSGHQFALVKDKSAVSPTITGNQTNQTQNRKTKPLRYITLFLTVFVLGIVAVRWLWHEPLHEMILSTPSGPIKSGRAESGLTMIPITGGTFMMGSPKSEKNRSDDECPHSISVGNFSIGKYEVTQADWGEVMCRNPSDNQGCYDCPVENVSWDDIQDFLKALNNREKASGKKYRLPTEAEWEYAARGGAKNATIATGGGFRYAGSDDLGKVAWYDSNPSRKTHPVGRKAPNQLGLYDMSGNVWEWCQDKYGPYAGCSEPKSVSDFRVVRGGSWLDDSVNCRAARRLWGSTGDRASYCGLRLAW